MPTASRTSSISSRTTGDSLESSSKPSTPTRRSTLSTPILLEFARARAPVPAIGGIGRIYVVPNISITGEFSLFRLPEELITDTRGHYVDFDLYGTVNFTNHVGAQFGYRSLDACYSIEEDTGALTLKGFYFGVVARY